MYRGALTFYLGKAWRNRGMEDWRSANFLSFHVDGSEAEWRHLRARNESYLMWSLTITSLTLVPYVPLSPCQGDLEGADFLSGIHLALL